MVRPLAALLSAKLEEGGFQVSSTPAVRLNADRTSWVALFGDSSSDPFSEATDILGQILDHPVAIALTHSCTSSLDAAAVILDTGPGSEVVVPAFTFPSSANGFLMRGATIRFADVDPLTGNVDASGIERVIGDSTKAVVCMHYAGISCDMDPILKLASSEGWAVVEDNAHGLFGSYHGVPLGRFGQLAGLSFHRTKNISCIDGGALVVNDPELAPRAAVTLDKGTNRAMFEAGVVSNYEWSGPGFSGRLSEPLAAILVEQLKRAPLIQARRHQVWDRYNSDLRGWAEMTGSRLPQVGLGIEHPAHIYWVKLPSRSVRSAFIEWCGKRGVEAVAHFASLPETSYGRRIAAPEDQCPNAADFADRVVRLPLHQDLNDSDVDRVLSAVTSFTP